jgi:hypothetical protein
MMTIVGAIGVPGWLVLVMAAIAGLAFGMLINALLTRGRKK